MSVVVVVVVVVALCQSLDFVHAATPEFSLRLLYKLLLGSLCSQLNRAAHTELVSLHVRE